MLREGVPGRRAEEVVRGGPGRHHEGDVFEDRVDAFDVPIISCVGAELNSSKRERTYMRLQVSSKARKGVPPVSFRRGVPYRSSMLYA